MNAPRCTLRYLPALLAVCLLSQGALAQSPAQFEQLRNRLVDDEIVAAGVTNPRVVQAMRDTLRHEFVPQPHRKNAYYDMALPIGDEQTISSPFIVAYMTESLDPQPTDRVLEIGTGSGYQAAVLSPLVKDVYTIEIVENLGNRAARTLKRLKYDNVYVKVGDGFQGWPEHAPFNKIIVTCSPEEVPQPLVDQLAEGGRMVIPVGERYQQTLYLFVKKEGKLVSEALKPTLFVPMTGKAEDNRQVQPDPLMPRVVNGAFEQPLEGNEFLPGWYYQRLVRVDESDEAPEGKHFATFFNSEPGRSSRAMQGFGIDGRKIAELEISAWVRTRDATQGTSRDMVPAIAISFYDETRRDLGVQWLGPWRGTAEWQQQRKRIRVPATAREAILRIGLFGATGEISFDDVQIKPIARE